MAPRQIIVPGAMPSRDANGRSLPAKFWFFEPGAAFSTPKPVYTTSDLTTPHPFPITSDAAGRWPQMWAEEGQFFDVGYARLDNGAALPSYLNIQPGKDAVLASVAMADASAEAAAASAAVAQEIANDLGDLDSAVTAAEQAATDAQTAAGSVAGTVTEVTELKDETKGYRDEAREARDEAVAIVGFDPTKVLQVDVVQAFSEPEKLQGRGNIGAQPVLALVDRQKVGRPAIVAGVLTLDCANLSVFIVSWNANITSLVLTNLAPGTDMQVISLILVAAGATSFSPGAAYHPLGNNPFALSTTAGDRNYLTLMTADGGTIVDYAFAGFAR